MGSIERNMRNVDRTHRKRQTSAHCNHYYEFPDEHNVCRHYGVKNQRYVLMHFYDDIDAWELYDLKTDPSQLNNIYGKPGTEAVTRDLKKELLRLQEQYNDPIRHKM